MRGHDDTELYQAEAQIRSCDNTFQNLVSGIFSHVRGCCHTFLIPTLTIS